MLSIVIPTLNAASRLPAVLRSVAMADEVIVADGGSEDNTLQIARAAGARVIDAPRGRGPQIISGIGAARGEWLLLLHGDTWLDDSWPAAAAMAMRDRTRAGYFRFALDCADAHARRIERMVAWRCRNLGLPYGDQGLLIARELLDRCGGVRPLPIMEDVDLVRRIGGSRLVMLDASAVTSADRWMQDGWYSRSARNLMCLALWYSGVSPGLVARIYK